jgi:hypothetical protein
MITNIHPFKWDIAPLKLDKEGLKPVWMLV